MLNKNFIELITILEEKDWDYAVNTEGLFCIILDDEEFSCYKWEHDKVQRIIEKVLEWQ